MTRYRMDAVYVGGGPMVRVVAEVDNDGEWVRYADVVAPAQQAANCAMDAISASRMYAAGFAADEGSLAEAFIAGVEWQRRHQ